MNTHPYPTPIYDAQILFTRIYGFIDPVEQPHRLTITSPIAYRKSDDVVTKTGTHYKIMNWKEQP